MKELRDIHKMVERTLEDYPATRDSDTYLFLIICREISPVACGLPFGTVLERFKDFGIPKFGSVSRARRKIQSQREDLRGSDQVTEGRFQEWKEFREYATEE